MLRSCLVAALASAFFLTLSGCQKVEDAPQPGATSSAPAGAPIPLETATPLAQSSGADLPSYSHNPAEALDGFAAAIEAHDWPSVRPYWGDKGERSGMDQAAFSAKWDQLTAPEVTIGPGSQEGAAGSLFYTAPITIVDGKRTLRGEVTIRRVNDVDGATTEQLRWHVESLTLPL